MAAWIAPAVAGAATIIGSAIAKGRGKRQIETQRALNADALEKNKAMALFNNEQQMKMWEATGPQGQIEQYDIAGMNPALMYGMGGGGGQTAQAAQGQGVSAGQASADETGMQIAGMGQQLASQINLMKAQKDNLNAQTRNLNVDADKKEGIDTEVSEMDKIIKEFAGKEAKDYYEQVKAPNRGIEEKTYRNEMEAKQGIAQNIFELYEEGKLKEKSIAEIEGLIIQNAKTRAERAEIEKQIDLIEEKTKGQKLENIITEIETKLQKETGLDKNSPAWSRMIGRMLVKYFGGK